MACYIGLRHTDTRLYMQKNDQTLGIFSWLNDPCPSKLIVFWLYFLNVFPVDKLTTTQQKFRHGIGLN